jgi:uncharacterized damage-inducible protein DinB
VRPCLVEEGSMTVADLVRLYDYGYWANARLFRVISELSPDEFVRELAGSHWLR